MAHFGHTLQESLTGLTEDGIALAVGDERGCGEPDVLDGLGGPS